MALPSPHPPPSSVTKYQTASTLVGKVLDQLVPQVVAGAALIDLCAAGDKLIDELAATVYNKKGLKVLKGIAFPTAVSVNNAVSHVSPLKGDEGFPALVDGDVVKIQLGVHIDGVRTPPSSLRPPFSPACAGQDSSVSVGCWRLSGAADGRWERGAQEGTSEGEQE